MRLIGSGLVTHSGRAAIGQAACSSANGDLYICQLSGTHGPEVGEMSACSSSATRRAARNWRRRVKSD
jgi:sulfatase maturation enzyme AslB (radical SAM superfamily)